MACVWDWSGGGVRRCGTVEGAVCRFFLVNIFIQDDMDTCTQHGPVTGVKVGPECFKWSLDMSTQRPCFFIMSILIDYQIGILNQQISVKNDLSL